MEEVRARAKGEVGVEGDEAVRCEAVREGEQLGELGGIAVEVAADVANFL